MATPTLWHRGWSFLICNVGVGLGAVCKELEGVNISTTAGEENGTASS